MQADDLAMLKEILELVPEIEYITLAIAHGYCVHFVEVVKQVRKDFPHHTIVVCEFC